MKHSTSETVLKTLLFLLLSPILYFWYLFLWPLGYFFARFRSSQELIDKLENSGYEWLQIIAILFLWLFCSIIIAILFLIYSFIQYLKVHQNLSNALRGLFGLAWIILFFQKFLKITT